MFRQTALRQVRYNSSGTDASLFLSKLMSRIDNINTNREKQRLTNNTPAEPKDNNKGASAKAAPKTTPRKADAKARAEKIKVADHPLFLNWMDERNFKSSDSGSKDNRSKQRPQRAGGKPQRTNQRPQRDAKKSTQRSKPRSSRSLADKPAKDAEAKPMAPVKAVEPQPLQIKIDGDTFLYGKSTTTQLNTSTRVAAVTKEALLNSKYPFKLPKSIIERAPKSPKNRFILQKNFNLHVDETWLQTRARELVKGQVPNLTVPKSTPAEMKSSATSSVLTLMGNGDYSFPQKEHMMNAASGLVTPKDLVGQAHWVR